MAFTADEKANLLFYLGYSGFEDDGPAMRAINSLDSKEPTMGAIVRDLLDKLRDVDCQIFQAMPLAKAISTGGVQLRAHYTLNVLRDLGRQYVDRLASFTKIQVGQDIFSPGGKVRRDSFYSGDPAERRVNPAEGVPTIGQYGDLMFGNGSRKL